jgi:hypothetical protein
MTHKFSIGQTVDLTPVTLRRAAAGAYEILHLMPESDASRDDPSYRVKSISEKHERVVSESELTASAEPAALPA